MRHEKPPLLRLDLDAHLVPAGHSACLPVVCLIVSAPFAAVMAALSDEIALGVMRYTEGVQQEIEQLSRETERLKRSRRRLPAETDTGERP